MNLDLAESESLAGDIVAGLGEANANIVLCPPFTSLAAVKKVVEGSAVKLGAQDIFYQQDGAFTGEISADMLTDVGCEYVIVGHSERRKLGDTNDIVRKKMDTAQDAELNVILCVGESLADRKAGTGEEFVLSQLRTVLRDSKATKLLIAYEPIWAIGTGNEATKEQVEPMLSAIKSTLSSLNIEAILLYGGSVNGANVNVFMQTGFDGVLVGGASLKSDSFLEIVKACN